MTNELATAVNVSIKIGYSRGSIYDLVDQIHPPEKHDLVDFFHSVGDHIHYDLCFDLDIVTYRTPSIVDFNATYESSRVYLLVIQDSRLVESSYIIRLYL